MKRMMIMAVVFCLNCFFLSGRVDELESRYKLNIQSVQGESKALKTVDILIMGGTIITMDSDRRVIEDGAVAIAGDRIAEVGRTQELQLKYRAKRMIDPRNKVVMPGLIDGHGHAGHTLVKTMGMGRTGEWWRACEVIYAEGSDEEFWRADAL